MTRFFLGDLHTVRKSPTSLLIAVNTLVFVLVTYSSGSLFNPDPETLISFGAKETVLLARGDMWRLITPIFLHIGILHFALNNFALHYVGRVIERILGHAWFYFLFLAAGVFGNLCSSLTNISIGAGASGAIFGLIGVGVIFEWAHQYSIRAQQTQFVGTHTIDLSASRPPFKLIPGPFTSIAVLNIALAVGINTVLSIGDSPSIGIDNAAHLGGLGCGIALGLAFLLSKPTPILRPRPRLGYGIIAATLLLGVILTREVLVGERAVHLIMERAAESTRLVESFAHYSRALMINPIHPEARFARAKLLLFERLYKRGMEDLEMFLGNPLYQVALEELSRELEERGDPTGSKILRESMRLGASSEKDI